MKNQLPSGETPPNVYVAWSLYTGPANVIPLWEHSRWITGEWNGVKDDVKKDIDSRIDALVKDIDSRIDALVKVFCPARDHLSKGQNTSAATFLVIPEFYFHSGHGPYPKIKIGKYSEYPYEYILSCLQEKLKEIQLEDGETWVLCIGSILTCNISNIPDFLKSSEVIERRDELNKKIHPQLKSIRMKKGPYIKAMGYIHADNVLSDWTNDIDSLMKVYRADPLCIVRNRGAVLKIKKGKIECFSYEKQNEATVDLTMGILKGNEIETGDMITEWVAGYPLSSIIDGDKNPESSPTAARISITDPDIELGVEVCLDHRLKRLRRTVGMAKDNGAAADNPPLDVQIITSGGMQILDESVAAKANGAIFNADGCDPILDNYGPDGKPIRDGSGSNKCIACGVYMSSAQTMVEFDSHKYFSHSQLSFRCDDAEIDGYNNAEGTANHNGATFTGSEADPQNETLESYDDPVIKSVDNKNTNNLYAAGWGELHIYLPKKSNNIKFFNNKT